jgi:DNA-binding Lrp family transcriptional regulator
LKKIPNIQSIDGILGEYALIVQFEVRTKQKFADILSSIEKNMVQTLFQSYRIIETIDVYKLGGVILKRDVELAQVDDKRWQLLNLLRKNNNFRKWENRVDHEFFSEEDESFINKINLSREYETFNDQKIIQRFTITIDHPMPDFKTKFYMRIKPKQVGQYTQLAQQLMYEPNIHSLYRTGEDAGLLAILRTKDLRDFKDLIYRLYQTYEIRDTFTTVVVDEHLPSIYPPTMEASKKECVKR